MLGGLMPSPTIDLTGPPRAGAKSTASSRMPSRSSFATAVPTNAPETTSNPVTRAAVSLEYAALRWEAHCPLGMYITPSSENILVWDAVFFVHQGYYTDAILKLRITFPVDYPERPPAVQFYTDVFHPLISQQDGRLNLSPRFRPWRAKEHNVFHVLHWIKASFKKHALDKLQEHDCLNKEAFRYHESTSSFAALATQSASLSQSSTALYDKDHPSMAGKGDFTMMMHEAESSNIAALRSQLGLSDWKDDS